MGIIAKTAVTFCILVIAVSILQVATATLMLLITNPTFILLTVLALFAYLPLIIMLKLAGITRALILFATEEFKKL